MPQNESELIQEKEGFYCYEALSICMPEILNF